MMSGDVYEAAQKAAKKYKDGRVMHFYDPHQLSGRALAQSLGHSGKVAWDMYLFYPSGAQWRDLPPAPRIYMHQLRDSWADQSCLFEKEQLKVKLAETMKLMFP